MNIKEYMKAQINLNTVIGGLVLAVVIWAGASIHELSVKVGRIEAGNEAKVDQLHRIEDQVKDLSAKLESVQLDVARLKK